MPPEQQSETTMEWQQKFSPANQRRDCEHGSLARSCRICELEHEVFDLNNKLTIANLDAERLAIEVHLLVQVGTFRGLVKRGTRMASPVLFAKESLAEHDKVK